VVVRVERMRTMVVFAAPLGLLSVASVDDDGVSVGEDVLS